MLEYYKLILGKVSFDQSLFEKELKKSFNYLMPEEAEELLKWAKNHFNEYSELVERIQQLLL